MSVKKYINGAWQEISNVKNYVNSAWTEKSSIKSWNSGGNAWVEKWSASYSNVSVWSNSLTEADVVIPASLPNYYDTNYGFFITTYGFTSGYITADEWDTGSVSYLIVLPEPLVTPTLTVEWNCTDVWGSGFAYTTAATDTDYTNGSLDWNNSDEICGDFYLSIQSFVRADGGGSDVGYYSKTITSTGSGTETKSLTSRYDNNTAVSSIIINFYSFDANGGSTYAYDLDSFSAECYFNILINGRPIVFCDTD